MDDGAKILLGVVGGLLSACFGVLFGDSALSFVGSAMGAGLVQFDSALWNLTGYLWNEWSPNGISVASWAIAGLLCGLGVGPAFVAMRYRRVGTAMLFVLGGVLLAACLMFLSSRGERNGPADPLIALQAQEAAAAEALAQEHAAQELLDEKAGLVRLERLSSLLDQIGPFVEAERKSRERAQRKADEAARSAKTARGAAASKKEEAKAPSKDTKKETGGGSSGKSALDGKIRVVARSRVLLGGELKVTVEFDGLASRECKVVFNYRSNGWKSLPTASKRSGASSVVGRLPSTADMGGTLKYRVSVGCGSDTWSSSGSARIR